MPRSKRNPLTPRGGRRWQMRGRSYTNFHDVLQPLDEKITGMGHQARAEFTLADEARQTSRYDHSIWENTKLRREPIQFVSAGSINPLRPDEPTEENSPVSMMPILQQVMFKKDENIHIRLEKRADNLPATVNETVIVANTQQPETDANQRLSFDVERHETHALVKQDISPALERRPSCDSSSSSEVILFQGRNPTKLQIPHRTISLATIQTEIQAMEKSDHPEPQPHSYLDMTDDCLRIGGGGHRRRRRQNRVADSEENAIMADYIENLQENGELFASLHRNAYTSSGIGDTDHDVESLSEYESHRLGARVHDLNNKIEARITDYSAEDGYKPSNRGRLSPNNCSNSSNNSENSIDGDTKSNVIPMVSKDKNLKENELQNIAQVSSRSERELDSVSEQDEMNNEFDFMDWERPSIRQKRGKRAKAQVQFNSDSELEQRLQAAWSNDRKKKSQRKKRREELRALDMLSRKPAAGDLRTKYPTGMSLEQVAEELKAFLIGANETLIMPPMDKHARKIVHELANKFNVKSKSTGKAEQRRPTLYRTGRTFMYEEISFANAIKKMHRKFFPRPDIHGKQPRTVPHHTGHSAAVVRDGEVVGGAAPELGVDNRGRTMLEKMGWSTGMALGAMDNKGILQPVTHTMKRSKAGLG